MQRIAILVLIVAVAVGVYLVIQETGTHQDSPRGDDDASTPTPTPDNGDGEPGLQPPDRPGPKPKAEVMQLQAPASLLMIGRGRDSWAATLELTFRDMKDLSYRVWYLPDPKERDKSEGTPGPGQGLPELKGKPTGAYLEAENIQVLVLDQADPHALGRSFWDVVAERVRAGRMGLYVRPGIPIDEAGQAQAQHPVLTHPVTADLMPVVEATAIEGQTVAGVFKEKQPLRPTPEGTKHPATRLVDDPDTSVELWTEAGRGKGSWGTKFCYPVNKVRDGAVVLATIEAGASIPAIITLAAPARVLWVGNIDFGGRETHFTLEKDRLRRILLTHWWVWLAGQAPR